MNMSYEMLTRILKRCGELAQSGDVIGAVKRVYDDRVKDAGLAFFAAQENLRVAEGTWAKEHTEAATALEGLDQPYRLTRSVVAAYLTHEVIPDTLKALPTHTDKVGAIETLRDILEQNEDQEWAGAELNGEFGTKASTTITEVGDATASDKTLAKAREDRAKAGAVAWERYLAFKRVVRTAYGSSSPQYRRIHHRQNSSAGEGETPS